MLAVGAFLLGGVVTAQESTASFFDHSHAAWSALLTEFVHEEGLVDYVGLGEERERFDTYVHSLEAVAPRNSPPGRGCSARPIGSMPTTPTPSS